MLLALIVVLAVLVVVDRAGLLGVRNAADETGARAVYLARAQLLARERALVASAAEWDRAAAEARREWLEAADSMVRGRTVELAQAAFRERLLKEVQGLGISGARADATGVDPPAAAPVSAGASQGAVPEGEAGPVRLMTFTVQFDTSEPDVLYKLIDRLENLGDVRVNVTDVRIDGPGMKQILPAQAVCSLVVQALALIEPAAPAESEGAVRHGA